MIMAVGSLILMSDQPAVLPTGLDALATDIRATATMPFRSGESVYSVPMSIGRGKSVTATLKIENSGGRVKGVLTAPESAHVSTPLTQIAP